MDYLRILDAIISDKRLMNSYKLYFLKFIIANTSEIKNTFMFYDLACWMCAFSFNDVIKIGKRVRPLDKLYDIFNT